MNTNTDDAIRAELQGQRDYMDTKFLGLERIISDMREWMSRLTDTVERQAENRDRVVGLEHRVGHLEAENGIQREALQTARDHQVRTGVIIAIAASVGTAFLGAVAVAAATMLMG